MEENREGSTDSMEKCVCGRQPEVEYFGKNALIHCKVCGINSLTVGELSHVSLIWNRTRRWRVTDLGDI